MLILNKCSIEKTKQKLDAYYSIRNFIPEFFRHHPLSEEMKEVARKWYEIYLKNCFLARNAKINLFLFSTWVQSPTLWKGLYSINFNKIVAFDDEKINGEHLMSHLFNVAEIRMREDVAFKDVTVVDFKDTKLSQLLMFTPSLLKKMHAVLEVIQLSKVSVVKDKINIPKFLRKINASRVKFANGLLVIVYF